MPDDICSSRLPNDMALLMPMFLHNLVLIMLRPGKKRKFAWTVAAVPDQLRPFQGVLYYFLVKLSLASSDQIKDKGCKDMPMENFLLIVSSIHKVWYLKLCFITSNYNLNVYAVIYWKYQMVLCIRAFFQRLFLYCILLFQNVNCISMVK